MFTSSNFKRVGGLIYRAYYKYLFKHAVRLLCRTRLPILKKSNLWIGAIQQNMIKYRIKFEQAAKEGKLRLAANNGPKEAFDIGLKCNKEFLRALKDICDGIAWRNLNYQRPIIRLMSENAPSNNIGPDHKVLIRLLGERRNLRDRVLINDLTHCLRIADLTVITPKDKIFLYEVKERKGHVKKIDVLEISRRIRRYKRNFRKQEKRQWIAQYAIIDKKIKTPNREIDIINLYFKINTHIKKIKRLIKEADRNNFSSILLEPGYLVEICALDKMFKEGDRDKIKKQLAKFEDLTKTGWSEITLRISNYDTFYSSINDQFMNFTPFSVLPLSNKNCVRLMMGQLYMRFCFDLEELKKKFEASGWNVEVSDWKTMGERNKKIIKKIKERKGELFDHVIEETIFRISKKDVDGEYVYKLPFNLVVIMLSSFYTTDYLLNMVEAAYLNAKSEKIARRLITFNCVREKQILN